MIDPERQEEIYITLNQAWRYEISVKTISDIKGKENFEKDVRSLVTVLENQIRNAKQDVARQIYKKTLKNVAYMLEDLMDLRAMKILLSTKNLKKLNESFLFPIEIEYYRQLYTAFRGYSKTKNMLMNGRNSHHSPIPPEEISESLQQPELHPSNSIEVESSMSPVIATSDIVDQDLTPAKSNLDLNEVEDDEFPDVDWENLDAQKEANPPIISQKGSPNPSPAESISYAPLPPKKGSDLQKRVQQAPELVHTAPPSDSDNLITVRILKEMPALVDGCLRVYGPFKTGDLANIPLHNAEVLIDEHLAEPIHPR